MKIFSLSHVAKINALTDTNEAKHESIDRFKSDSMQEERMFNPDIWYQQRHSPISLVPRKCLFKWANTRSNLHTIKLKEVYN